MCGIWAVFGLNTNLYRHCGTTFTNITHRGPDAWRVEYDARVKVRIVDDAIRNVPTSCVVNRIAVLGFTV